MLTIETISQKHTKVVQKLMAENNIQLLEAKGFKQNNKNTLAAKNNPKTQEKYRNLEQLQNIK